MKKIEAIVRPEKIDEIKEILNKHDIKGLTISQVSGCGQQKGQKNYYRGAVVQLNVLPKIKIEIIAADAHVADIVKIISETAKTGEIGDGKIFVYNVEEVVRIRTGETGETAI